MSREDAWLAAVVLFALLALMLVNGCAWSPETRAEAATVEALMVVDTMQTVSAVRYPCYEESNPLLGSHPTSGKVIAFAVLRSAGHLALTNWMEAHDTSVDNRRILQGIFIAVEAFAVIGNYSQGGRWLGADRC